MSSYASMLSTLIYSVPATLIAIVLHEVAHAGVSYLCGDKNVKADGRLSLNPLKHLDPLGTICLIFLHFGWAKPVMVNTSRYKHKKLDFCLVALAGPLMNFFISFVALIGFFLIRFTPDNFIWNYLSVLMYYIAALSVGLGVFNLIPIPPLDGSNVLLAILPSGIEQAIRPYRQYFYIALMLMLFFGSFSNILSYVQSGILNGMWDVIVKIFGFTLKSSTGYI